MGGSPSAHAARRAPVQGQLPVGSSPPFRYFCSQCASHRAALQVIVPLELRWAVNRLETWWTAPTQHHRAVEELGPLRRANAGPFHGRFDALNDFVYWLAVRDRYKNFRISRQ